MSNDNGASSIQRRGMMLVLSSPSGAGKTTLSRQLLDNDKQIQLSVSCTTRQKRPGERDGREYFFISEDAFDEMLAADELLEWAPFVDHRSGTPRAFVEQSLGEGRDVILEIDVKGAEQVRAKVESGGGGMPSFSGSLTPQQIGDVAAFVATRAG